MTTSVKTTLLRMKAIGLMFFITLLLFPCMAEAQDKERPHRFDFSTAAGISFTTSRMDDDAPGICPTLEMNFNFRLRGNRHIGLTYSFRDFSGTTNESYSLFRDNVVVNFKDYHYYFTTQNFGVEFGKEIFERLHFAVGISLFVSRYSGFRIPHPNQYRPFELDFVGSVDTDMAMTAAMSYYFPINSYFNIGLRTKCFLSLAYGVETITVTPVARFSF